MAVGYLARPGSYAAVVINRRADRPLRLQLADLLRAQIADGEYQPGENIPSMRTLAQTHGVSEDVARAAVRILAGEGLVVVDPPYGTRVRVPAERKVVKAPRGGSLVGRRATVQECEQLELEPGAWVQELRDAGGRVTGVYAAEECEFRFR